MSDEPTPSHVPGHEPLAGHDAGPPQKSTKAHRRFLERPLESAIFGSRWIQAPMYLGLILALGLYCVKFYEELYHLATHLKSVGSEELMLAVLSMVDVTMVANLVVMVLIGGYETFVSSLHVDDHPDCPDWLEHINAATMKIKLAASLVSISGIHLLKAFINIEEHKPENILWMVVIHTVFLLSALILSISERLLPMSHGNDH